MENPRTIEEMLVKEKRMTENQLARARILTGSARERERLRLLVELGYVSEDDILDCICRKEGTARTDAETAKIDPRAAALLTGAFAREHHLLPVAFKEDSIIVAVPFWADQDVLDETAVFTGVPAVPVLAAEKELEKAIERVYGEEEEGESAERIDSAPLVRAVNAIIEEAYERNASDIHVEPWKDRLTVRFRINGDLICVRSMELLYHSPIVTRLKLMAGMDIAQKRLPQDGKYHYERGGISTDLRISSLPTIYGEKMVLRLLGNNRDPALMDIGRLGMEEEQREVFDRMLRAPFGLVLVTGPTGSGKSTTLYAALNRLASGKLNIVTVEEPVEKMINGITQVQVNPKAGLTFAAALRSILRQDPDVIMVGEMRDEETVSMGIRAAITGHLVFSTLHTGDCASAVIRLRSMGAPSYLIAASLTGIAAQRLVKILCPFCKRPENVNGEKQDALRQLTGQEIQRLWRAPGCPKCNGTGYIRRRAVYEMMEADGTVKDMIRRGTSAEELRRYQRKKGFLPLKDYVVKLLLAGETDMEEAEKVIYSAE